MVSALIIAELARGHRWSRNLKPNFYPGQDLNPEPHDWQSSMLTTRPPRTPTNPPRNAAGREDSFKQQLKVLHMFWVLSFHQLQDATLHSSFFLSPPPMNSSATEAH